MHVIGVAEVFDAGLVLAPGHKALSVSLRFSAAMVLAVVMAGATGTHIVHAGCPVAALTPHCWAFRPASPGSRDHDPAWGPR